MGFSNDRIKEEDLLALVEAGLEDGADFIKCVLLVRTEYGFLSTMEARRKTVYAFVELCRKGNKIADAKYREYVNQGRPDERKD